MYFQLSSQKAAGLSWIRNPEMVHCLDTKHNHRLLCTQHALLKEGDCLWFLWCIPKWHSLLIPGALPGWLKVRVTALQTSFSSRRLQWKGCSRTGASRQEEKHHCWTQERPHPRMEKASCPPASVLSHKYSSFPKQTALDFTQSFILSKASMKTALDFMQKNPHSPPSVHVKALSWHRCSEQQQKSSSENCQFTTKPVPSRPPCFQTLPPL